MITLEANYSKKIGLPGYSSHQFSVTLKSELSDIAQAEKESARLYEVLQHSVDRNEQRPGNAAKIILNFARRTFTLAWHFSVWRRIHSSH